MPVFKWTKVQAIFVPELDEEHRTIFLTARELQDAIMQGVPLPQVTAILDRLIAHSEEHFAHEESLMCSFRYPIFDWHKHQHDTARKRLAQFAPLIVAGDEQAPLLLIDFLAQWLKNHIGLTDRMMGAYLRNQQRQLAA